MSDLKSARDGWNDVEMPCQIEAGPGPEKMTAIHIHMFHNVQSGMDANVDECRFFCGCNITRSSMNVYSLKFVF